MAGKRRANNEGSITRRKDGKWMAKFPIGIQSNGKIRYKYFYADTQKEVIQKLEEFKISLNMGMQAEKGDVTVSQWLKIWMEECKKDLKPTTRASYLSNIRIHIDPYIGGVKLNELKTGKIQNMLNEAYDEGKKSSSLFIKVLNVLNGALKQAVKRKMIPSNPCDNIVYPVDNAKEIICYSIEEQKAFENALEGEKNKVLFKTYLYTGARLGELPALTWNDIHFEERYIDINKKVVVIHDINAEKRTEQQTQDFCKTKNSKRKIYITDHLINLLKEQKQQQIKKYEELGLEWTDENIVFPSEANTILYVRNIQTMFQRIRKKAGIEYGTMHTLRHTYASRCFEADINIKVISQQLGHKNTKITYDTYIHVMPNKHLEEINKLNFLFE